MLQNIPSAKTLGDLFAFVSVDQSLTVQRRDQMRSAIKTFAKVAGRSPADIIAEPTVIRALRKKAPWKLAGVSKGRWANVLSLVTAAMELAGIRVHRSRRNFPLDEPWQGLLRLHPHQNGCRDLTRFAGWCTMSGIGPEHVTVKVFDDYLDYLQSASILRQPRERWHVARRAWNSGVEAVPGWPATYVPNTASARWCSKPWSSFPPGLEDEINAYVAYVTTDDPFDDDRKVVRRITADNYVQRLKEFASRLVDEGEPIERFDTLRAFVDLALVKRGLTLIVGDRTLEQAAPAASATSIALLSVAKYLRLPASDLAELRRYAGKFRRVPAGMNAKNKARLAPLQDEALKRRLLRLPLDIHRELAKVSAPTVRQAQRYQMALLLEVLINAPMRIQNVASLDLVRHLNRPLPGTQSDWRISIPAHEVKNGLSIDVSLTKESGELIERYLTTFRPVLAVQLSTALFVSQSGSRKGPSALSKQFRTFIERELGITVNVHLMRHIAAFVYLSANPGDYETVRRFLGHQQIETTIRFYAGTETDQAYRRYDELIRKQRGIANDDADQDDDDADYL